MSKKNHHKKGKNKQPQESELDIGFNSIYNPPEDGNWAEWIIENNMLYASDVTIDDYQALRRLLLRGSGYILNDIARPPYSCSNPDLFGQGLGLNEYRWYRDYDDERKYTQDYKSRKRFIEDPTQYLQRREVTNLDKFQVPLDEIHLRRMTLFYGIQLFDDFGNMVFASILYKDSGEPYLLVKQYFIDASKRISVTNLIPEKAVLRTNTIVYWCDYPQFTSYTKSKELKLSSFTTSGGDIVIVPESLPYKE